MNESAKTITFVGVAVVLAALAGGSHFLNQPTNSKDFELVGKPFFEKFESAAEAKSLSVVVMDPETARLKRFSVENKDGLWRIPSHYDYPAEAAHRLAATATSVMGIERESLAGRLAKEHERLGVMDPLDEDLEDPEAAGQRLTLKDANDEILIDYIIGKQIDEEVTNSDGDAFGQQGNEKYYYVRRPDENQTYKVKLDIDLSTKFSDWIDPDLLRVDSSEITRVSVNNYSIEEDRSNPLAQQRALFKQQGDILNLSRPTSGGVWELEGLKADKEELEESRVTDILGVLDELKIAGVRPKQKFKDHVLLTADLKLNEQPEFKEDPQGFGRAIENLQIELEQRGYNLAGNAEQMELVSHFGEMTIGTNNGVVYTLHVGKAVEGDEKAIEIGGASSSVEEQEAADKQDDGREPSDEAGDSKAGDTPGDETSEEDNDEEIDNRYLLVRVSLDRDLITPQPIEPKAPVEPVAPAGYTPKSKTAEPEKKEGEAEAPEDVKPPAGAEAVENDAPPEPRVQDDRPAAFAEHDAALKAFEELKVQHGLDMTQWEEDKKAFEEKAKESQKVVDELNERFGDWYYVMSGDNLKTLRTERSDLVKKKELPPGTEPPAEVRPDISFPDLPPTGQPTPAPGDANASSENESSEPEAPKMEKPVDIETGAENSTEENSTEGNSGNESSGGENSEQEKSD